VSADYNYTGDILVGAGPSDHSGGSGTALVTITKKNAPYNILIMENSRGASSEQGQTYFDEGDSQVFSFDEIRITDKVNLLLKGQDINVIAKRLICTGDSVIHVPDYVNLTVDTTLQETTIPCSLDVARNGELRLPRKVTFLGPDNNLAGKKIYLLRSFTCLFVCIWGNYSVIYIT